MTTQNQPQEVGQNPNLSFQEFANRVCAHLPDGYMLTLEMEKGAAWFELYNDNGERVTLPDSPDKSLIEQANEALLVAGGWL